MNIIDVGLKYTGAFTYGNKPNKIVLHNADASSCTIQDINVWHKNNGWIGCGYHFFIRKDGSIYKGRPENAIGAHCQGSNTGSLGICFEGDYMKETMPAVQYNAGIKLIKYLTGKYGPLEIYGHKELYNTDCPGINFPLSDFKVIKVKSRKLGWNQDDTGWWYCTNLDKGYYYKSEWKFINSEWYSFDDSGYARHDMWIQDKGKWYYLRENCMMVKNQWLWLDGECYCFDANGAMYIGCITPDGYKVDKTGAWVQ